MLRTQVTVTPARIDVPLALRRSIIAVQKPSRPGLIQVGDDIWMSSYPIAQHEDATEDGMITYGLILINDPAYIFFHGGKLFDIPVGSLYIMNGRVPHGIMARVHGPKCGLFAALIWDMPIDHWDFDKFQAELMKDPRLADVS